MRTPSVVNKPGFDDLRWLNVRGHGHCEDLRVQERFTRRDFGDIDVAVTIIDLKAFTKPLHYHFRGKAAA